MIGLDAALGIAGGGIANVGRQLALVSRNVANAGTADYAAETGTQSSVTAEGQGLGVRTGPATRNIDAALQASVFAQDSEIAGLDVTHAALAAIDQAQGTPGQGDDIPSALSGLRAALSALRGDPSNAAGQQQATLVAARLASRINDVAGTIATQRQAAQDDLSRALRELGSTLDRIGTLSDQIIALRGSNRETADLESQRDAALHDIHRLVGAKALPQPNGDMLVVTTAGLSLPTRQGPDVFGMAGANLAPATWYPANGVPGVTLRGVDVTAQLRGGRIGADLSLRDDTLPGLQAGMDEFAYTLASRFDAQGLRLFSDPAGNVPAAAGPPAQAGHVGFAAIIGLNPAVAAAPALVRDGTHAVADDPAGATAFTPNPPGGPAGFATLLARILDNAMGTEAQAGVAQPTIPTTGLGPGGSLSVPFAPPDSLAAFATTLVASQSAQAAAVSARLDDEQAYGAAISGRLAAATGVDMDKEMSLMLTLQTAYGANARVLSTVQSLISDLMNAVRP